MQCFHDFWLRLYLDKPYSYTGVRDFKAHYFCYSETSKDAFFKTCWLLFLVCKGNILFTLLSRKKWGKKSILCIELNFPQLTFVSRTLLTEAPEESK